MLLRSVTIACLLAAIAPAAAQSRNTAPAFGAGRLTCEQLTPDQGAQALEWLYGYLTGFAESFGPRVWLGEATQVAEIFQRSCVANPKATLVETARSVILTLQARRLDGKK